MSKHTPGPWHIHPDTDRYIEASSEDDHIGPIAEVRSDLAYPYHDLRVASTRKANAQLISSAPDLLNALEELLSEYEDHRAQFGDDVLWQKFERVEVIEQARTAISKARGKTE